MLLTFEVDVLILSEDNVLPGWNSKDPGLFVLVRNDDGLNSTANYLRHLVGLNIGVLDHDTLVYVAEEADMVRLE